MFQIKNHKPAAIVAFNKFAIQEESILKSLGLPWKALRGKYLGTEERSYLIVLESPDDLMRVSELASDAEQECILYLDSERNVTEVCSDGSSKDVGVLESVSESEALKSDSWTHDFINNNWFLIKPK